MTVRTIASFAVVKTLKISYTTTGFTVEMTDGTASFSTSNKDGTSTTTPHRFKTLSFSFANGKIRSWAMQE